MQIKNKKKITFNASKLKVGVVVSRFNQDITEGLLASALLTLERCGVKEKNIKVISVAGAIEIPHVLNKLAKSKKRPDCLVALACIIRGDTPHFDYVCKMAQEGVLEVILEEDMPIGFGVLTVNNKKQAKSRLHVGGEATLAALELALIKY